MICNQDANDGKHQTESHQPSAIFFVVAVPLGTLPDSSSCPREVTEGKCTTAVGFCSTANGTKLSEGRAGTVVVGMEEAPLVLTFSVTGALAAYACRNIGVFSIQPCTCPESVLNMGIRNNVTGPRVHKKKSTSNIFSTPVRLVTHHACLR